MTVVLVSLFLLYIILLIVLIIGWNRAIHSKPSKFYSPAREPLISIIIPARNEGHGIGLLLQDLSRQHYSHFQVIIVDDHSVDNTREIVRHHVSLDDRFELQQCRAEGKKEALSQGIHAATGSIMVTTDADCRVGEDWLAGLREYFADQQVQMVFGAVKMQGDTFFERVQAIEFMSLIGSGAATAALGFPTMCNGANLAFRKSAFESVNGYHGNLHIPSGDDEFLMKKILRRYFGGIKFAADPRTIVTTLPNVDLNQFIHQRVRWAGKWKLQQSYVSKALAIFVFCFQCAVILLPLGLLMQWISLTSGLIVWSLKIILEYIFLWRISLHLNVVWSWPAFILLQLIYPFYATLIGLVSSVRTFEWKGRKMKSLAVSN